MSFIKKEQQKQKQRQRQQKQKQTKEKKNNETIELDLVVCISFAVTLCARFIICRFLHGNKIKHIDGNALRGLNDLRTL